MNRILARSAILLSAGAVSLAWNATASAQTVVVPQDSPPPPPPSSESTVVVSPTTQPAPAVAESPAPTWRPNRTLLMSGLITFGVPYIASVTVAATSGHTGDPDLYVPVVGPWLDFGQRGGCPADGNCAAETGNKALLIGDGILQSVGALQVLGSFIFPEITRPVATVTTGSHGEYLRFLASQVGHGYGVTALGEF